MPRRKLAIFLAASMGALCLVEGLFAVVLAAQHKPFAIALASLTACIPGFVVAALAWQGRLPSGRPTDT